MKLPHSLSYTHSVKVGDQFMWRIRINPNYKDDEGLHAHEQEHVKQWYQMTATFAFLILLLAYSIDYDWVLATPMSAVVHGLAYTWIPRYRKTCEVEAFKRQLTFYPEDIDFFARLLATGYNLSLRVSEAKELLES